MDSETPHIMNAQDLRLQSFDGIRFASYRTASKLRYIQRSTNLHLVDIWNVIEAFRENGLNTMEPQSDVSVARLETLVSSLYHNLNKRLTMAQQVPVESKASLLLNWLISAYSHDNSGKMRVFSIKVALAIMCAGKLIDKLRYIFSQISDGTGLLVHNKLCDFLREILAIPAAVYESPSFNYKDSLETEIFSPQAKISVNDFIGAMITEPGPPCLVWLPLLQRFSTVEQIVHPTACSVCKRENFVGFRYRCQRCSNYQLCQECFWHGRTTLPHTNDHEVKEYTSYKSPSRQIGYTLRKSFRCVPEKPIQAIPIFPEKPEKTLNLSHIVPPSPLPSHNGFGVDGPGGMMIPSLDRSTLDSRGTFGRSLDSAGPGSANPMYHYSSSLPRSSTSNDDEHHLIARYAARLAMENRSPNQTAINAHNSLKNVKNAIGGDPTQEQREMIAALEAKNKEISIQITKLRQQQEAEQLANESPHLMSELLALRQRKIELENHLAHLQESRRSLMQQLETLMKVLKTQQQQQQQQQQQSSPRSTPNSSPRSGKSPPIPVQKQPHNQSNSHHLSQPQGTV